MKDRFQYEGEPFFKMSECQTHDNNDRNEMKYWYANKIRECKYVFFNTCQHTA